MKRDREPTIRAVGGAKKKAKIDESIAGVKRERPPTIRKVGNAGKKQKTADEKVTRLAGGKTLRRLKPKTYKE